MPLLLKSIFYTTDTEGKIYQFKDTTGLGSANNPGGYDYSGNIAYSAVSGVNFLIGNYLSLTSTSEVGSGDALSIYVEYVKTAGDPQVYDNKTITVGNIFIPHVSGLTVIAGDSFKTTGNYNPLITDWLPDEIQNPFYLNGDQLGMNTDSVAPDTLIQIEYEVFGNEETGAFAAVSGVKYEVTGTGIVSYKSDHYRQGEVFTAIDTTNITSISGSFGVSVYQGGNVNTFITSFIVTGEFVDLETQNILNPKPRPATFQASMASLFSKLDAMNQQANTGLVSEDQAYNLLVYLQQQVADLRQNIY